MPSRSFFALLVAALPAIGLCYTWPSPKLDSLESMRFEQTGYRSPLITVGVLPTCTTFSVGGILPGTQGLRSNAADWVRAVCGLTIFLFHISSLHLRFLLGLSRYGDP
jgi:hypothetical protein